MGGALLRSIYGSVPSKTRLREFAVPSGTAQRLSRTNISHLFSLVRLIKRHDCCS